MPTSIKEGSSRSPQSYFLPSSRPLGIADNLRLLSLCCTYAREAAAEGRLLGAHHLFQGAIGYFDRIQRIVARCQGEPFDSQKLLGSPTSVPDVLLAARAELDACAESIYLDASQRASIPSTPGGDSR